MEEQKEKSRDFGRQPVDAAKTEGKTLPFLPSVLGEGRKKEEPVAESEG